MTIPTTLDIRAKRAWTWAHALRRDTIAEAAIPLARCQIAQLIGDPHPSIRRLTGEALLEHLRNAPPPPPAA